MAAGDIVYIGPGTYRETLTTSHAGSSGSPISYIGDEGGTLTDGIGGVIRLTGSNDDKTVTRANCVSLGHAWRTFRGIYFNRATTPINVTAACAGLTVDQCVFRDCTANSAISQNAVAVSGGNWLIKRSLFVGQVNKVSTSNVDNSGDIIENCVFMGANSGVAYLRFARMGGWTVRNCLFYCCATGIQVVTAANVGQVQNVNNCVFANCNNALIGTATTDITENFNAFSNNTTDRTNTNTGANSNTSQPLFASNLLTLGIHTLIAYFLDSNSPLASIAGSGVAADDLYGTTREATSSWGPVQYEAGQRPADVGMPRSRVGQ